MEYTFAPVTTVGKLDYLQILIEEYLIEFKELYPSRPLTPKMHYLVHIPTWTKRYVQSIVPMIYNTNVLPHRCGPLVRQWCMRYEAKHRYFKKIVQTLGNFINVPKTVATRHQRYMCYKMTCSTNFLREENGYGTG